MKNKKIGIITILNVNNYGAELQAFALHHKLKLMGFDNEIINYLYYKNPNYKKVNEAKPLFPISQKTKLKDFILGTLDQLSSLVNPRIARTRKDRFNNFHADFTALSKDYRSYNSLYAEPLEYGTFIVGSDQVWNPNNPINLSPYFLSFAPKNSKTISYASSFGVSNIPAIYHPTYKKLLGNIQFLSTREASGVKLIREISDRKATHVVDPTLLLTKEEWTDLSVPFEESEPYILIFVFKNSKYITDMAFEIQKKTGYKIYRICKNEMRVESDAKIVNLRDLGPREFLGVYSKASIILTSSFHGTVFSLIFEKPFYTLTPANKNNNTRQLGLLEMVGLKERLIKENEMIDFNKITEIDYLPVKKKLGEKISESIDFLTNSLRQ